MWHLVKNHWKYQLARSADERWKTLRVFSSDDVLNDVLGQVFPLWWLAGACFIVENHNNGSMWICIHLNFNSTNFIILNQNFSFALGKSWRTTKKKNSLNFIGTKLQLFSINRVHDRSRDSLNYTSTFFHSLTNSVRKFFHCRVEMNLKNDVIKFSPSEERIFCISRHQLQFAAINCFLFKFMIKRSTTKAAVDRFAWTTANKSISTALSF